MNKLFVYPKNISNHGYRTKALAIEKSHGPKAALDWLKQNAHPNRLYKRDVAYADMDTFVWNGLSLKNLDAFLNKNILGKLTNPAWINNNRFKPFDITRSALTPLMLSTMSIVARQARQCPDATLQFNCPILPSKHAHKHWYKLISKNWLSVETSDNETAQSVNNHFHTQQLINLDKGTMLSVSASNKPLTSLNGNDFLARQLRNAIEENLINCLIKCTDPLLNQPEQLPADIKTIGKGPFIQYGPRSTDPKQYTGDGLRPWQLAIVKRFFEPVV